MDVRLIEVDHVMALIARTIQQCADLGDESLPFLRIRPRSGLMPCQEAGANVSEFRAAGTTSATGTTDAAVPCRAVPTRPSSGRDLLVLRHLQPEEPRRIQPM